jgi:hypothetical protein
MDWEFFRKIENRCATSAAAYEFPELLDISCGATLFTARQSGAGVANDEFSQRQQKG